MRKITLFIFGFIFLSSCLSGQENLYLNTGSDYSTNPPQYTIGCYYESSENKAIDMLIEIFGENYTIETIDLQETYKWKNVLIRKIDRKPLNVKVVRNKVNQRSTDGVNHEYEAISLYLEKDGKDILRPLKFRKRIKTKKFLVNTIK